MSVTLSEDLIKVAFGDRERPAQKELADAQEPGLRLRLAARQATWSVLAKTEDGARARIALGSWPSVSVEQARLFARSIRSTGDDVDEEEGDLTVAELLDRYRARRLSQLRKAKVIGRALEAALAPVKHRNAASLKRRDLAEIVDVMAERAPIHANRVLAYAKAFFNWAVGRGYLDANPAAAISKPAREVTRERTPSLAELAEIWRAAGTLGYPFGPIVKLLILTAARREEIGSMQVSELDVPQDAADGVWTLPAQRSKNGRAIRVPLAPLARRVVEAALKARSTANDFLFTTTPKGPVSGWSRAKARLDEAILAARRRADPAAAPMTPWRIHDLRRSFATHACDHLHVDCAVADRCLNHVGASTTSTVSRIYARSEMFDQRRAALTAWAGLIEAAVARDEAPSTSRRGRRPGRAASASNAGPV